MGLPLCLLRKRIENELEACRMMVKYGVSVTSGEICNFPVILRVAIHNVPALAAPEGVPGRIDMHELELELTDEYPYQKPTVRWLTDIFHPNIMHPLEGGSVCTKLLDGWTFGSTLATFIAGIEDLLANPNPECPLDTAHCTRAAEYLNKGVRRGAKIL